MRKLMTVAMLALTVGAFAQSGNKGNNQEGKSQSDIEVYILDENEMEVGAGKIGEICYRNPYVRGYLNLPEKTRKLLRGRLFHTGDAGSINIALITALTAR